MNSWNNPGDIPLPKNGASVLKSYTHHLEYKHQPPPIEQKKPQLT